MSKFQKANRLLNSRDFKATFDNGLKVVSRDMVVMKCDRKAEESVEPRLGLVVTRKFGNAVERNRFKRNIREIFRELLEDLRQSHGQFDFVVIARQRSKELSQLELKNSFEWCLRKARKIEREAANG